MLINQLNQDLSLCAGQLGWPADRIAVTYSDRPDLCQFQCNAPFRLAKELHRPPMAIATELAEAFARKFKTSSIKIWNSFNITISRQ